MGHLDLFTLLLLKIKLRFSNYLFSNITFPYKDELERILEIALQLFDKLTLLDQIHLE